MANHFLAHGIRVGLSLSMAVLPFHTWAQRSHGASPTSAVKDAGLLNTQDACFVVQDKSDKEKLATLDLELMALNAELGSNPEALASQARKLIEKSISTMAPQTRVALNAQLLMQKTAATLIQIQSDPTLSKELIGFQAALDENSKASQKLADAGKFSGADMVPDVSFQAYRMLKLHLAQKASAKSGDKISEAHESLFQAIQNSKSLSDEQKKQFRGNVTKITQASLATSNRATDQFTDNVEIRKNVAGAVRDTSVGAGLTIGGLMLLGGSTSSVTGSATLAGVGRLGGVGLKILQGAAGGASVAGGSRLVAGGAGNILRATFDQGDFFCDLAREHKDNGALLYAEAASAAKTGAVFGGIFSSGWVFLNSYGSGHGSLLAAWTGTATLVGGGAGLTGTALAGTAKEGLRNPAHAKKFSEALKVKSPHAKLRLIDEVIQDKGGLASRDENFERYIRPALVGVAEDSLSPQQTKKINEILDAVVLDYAAQNTLASDFATRPNDSTAEESAIEELKSSITSLPRKTAGFAKSLAATLPAASNSIFEGVRLELAGKRIRRILSEE